MSEEQKEAYRSLRARVSTGQNDKKVIAVIACGKNTEKSNISLCDYVVYNTSYDEAAKEILKILEIK